MSGREDRGPISPGLTGPAPRSGGRPARHAFRAVRFARFCNPHARLMRLPPETCEASPAPAWWGFASPLQTASRQLLVQALLARRGSKGAAGGSRRRDMPQYPTAGAHVAMTEPAMFQPREVTCKECKRRAGSG